jgi:hypothetical protein
MLLQLTKDVAEMARRKAAGPRAKLSGCPHRETPRARPGRFLGRGGHFRAVLRVSLLVLAWASAAPLWALDLDLQLAGRENHVVEGHVVISGDHAYVSSTDWPPTNEFDIYDVRDPAHPTLTRQLATTGWLYGLPLSPHFTYTPDANETWMVSDVSQPDGPQPVGGYKTIAAASGTAVVGTYAFAIDQAMTLQIIDIRNPALPQAVGSYHSSSGFRMVAVAGTTACLVANGEDLLFLDVSDPSNPVPRGTLAGFGDATSLALYSHYVLVGGSDSLQVIDITDPTHPQLTAKCRAYHAYVLSLSVDGQHACLGDAWGRLGLVDLSDPANPKLEGVSASVGYYTSGAAMAGGYAYAVAGRLNVLQIRPANPQRLAELPFNPTDNAADSLAFLVAVDGNEACLAVDGRIEIVDLTHPENPERVGTYSGIGGGWAGNFFAVGLSGHYAYVGGSLASGVGNYSDGLHVLDISTPAIPRRVGYYPLSN